MPQEILDSWMDYYEVADKNRIVIKGKEDRGFLIIFSGKENFDKNRNTFAGFYFFYSCPRLFKKIHYR